MTAIIGGSESVGSGIATATHAPFTRRSRLSEIT